MKREDTIYQPSTATYVISIFEILLGSILCAVAMKGILLPHGFLNAGFAGLAMIIHYVQPSLSLALIYLLLNVPLFIMGWRWVSRRFFFFSLFGMLVFSAAIQLINLNIPVEDQLLSAILAGIIGGIGSGIILRSLGSAGGTDILGVILLKKFSVRLGTTVLIFNSVILGTAAMIFSIDAAICTMIYIYVSSQIMDLVVTGLSKRKSILIISEEWQTIAQAIMQQERRGLTIIEARGAYANDSKQILYAIIAHRDLPGIKRLITSIDPQAFVVINDTLEVMGQRMGNQPHW